MRSTILAALVLATQVISAPLLSERNVPVPQDLFPNNATSPSQAHIPLNVTGDAVSLFGENSSNGTNSTLSAPFTPAGGNVDDNPVCKQSSFPTESIRDDVRKGVPMDRSDC